MQVFLESHHVYDQTQGSGAVFFLESHHVYDQTQGSGAVFVFTLLYRQLYYIEILTH